METQDITLQKEIRTLENALSNALYNGDAFEQLDLFKKIICPRLQRTAQPPLIGKGYSHLSLTYWILEMFCPASMEFYETGLNLPHS